MSAGRPVAFSLRGAWAALLFLIAAFTALFTATGFLGWFWWAFDLTSHFRAQYLAGALVIAVVHAFRRQWRWAGFAVVLAAVNAAVLLPHMGWVTPTTAAGSGPAVHAVLLNVRTENRQFGRVRDFLRETRPDFAVLEEIDAVWRRELEPLRDLFPYVLAETREDNFGIMLVSRHPLVGPKVVWLGDAEAPSVFARIAVGGTVLSVLGTHPLPPGGRENSRLRNQQLDAAGRFLNQQPGPKILLGDLNTTPWNGHFQRLLAITGLEDSSRGRGYQGSWPSAPFFLRIPIDQCLLSPELRVFRRSIGPDVGSDHLPVIVEFAAP